MNLFPPQDVARYCADVMEAGERATFEARLVEDHSALRGVLDQERIDCALRMLHDDSPDRGRLLVSILEVAGSTPRASVGRRILQTLQDERASGFWTPARAALAAAGLAAGLAIMIASYPEAPGPGAVAPAGISRNPVAWPFAADSPWNTPIGSGAAFEPVLPGGLDLEAGVHLVDAGVGHRLLLAGREDPSVAVRVGGDLISLPLPTDIPWGMLPETLHLIGADRVTLHEIIGARLRADGSISVRSLATADLRGSGIPPEFDSGSDSGLTRFAGSIRVEELRGGIRRAIGAVVSIEGIARLPDGSAHVWPAARATSDARVAERFHPGGNVHVGSLLAIPPEVDLGSLQIDRDGPAFVFAEALQNYGLYVKEAVDARPSGSPGLIVCIDGWIPAGRLTEISRELRRVTPFLEVVANNRPGAPGGGGRPTAAAPPPFTSGAQPSGPTD